MIHYALEHLETDAFFHLLYPLLLNTSVKYQKKESYASLRPLKGREWPYCRLLGEFSETPIQRVAFLSNRSGAEGQFIPK